MKRPSFANGPHAAQARDYIDQIDMDIADRQATLDMRLNRSPDPRAKASTCTPCGSCNSTTASRRCRSFAAWSVLLKDREEDRSYLNLARNKIHEIEESGSQQGDVATLVNDNLKRADELDTKGQRLEAQTIWNGVITLYGDNKELQQQVKYARARLQGEKVERTVFGLPKPQAKEAGPTKEKP